MSRTSPSVARHGGRTFLMLCVAAACVGCRSAPRISVDNEARQLTEATKLWASADALKDQAKYKEAAELYRQALAQREDLGGVWNNLGVCLMNTDELKNAAVAFHRAAELLPTDPRPVDNLGQVYYKNGIIDDAVRYFSEALDRDPNYLPSLRGAIACAQINNTADEPTRDRLRRGILLEKDPDWLRVMETQRLRVEQALKDQAGGRRSGG